MEPASPSWLTKEFLKKVLQNEDETLEVVVEDVRMSRAVSKGTNNVCLVLRVEVDFRMPPEVDSLQTSTLIVKASQKNGLCELYKALGCLDKEMTVYKDYLPKLKKLLNGEELSPTAYYSPGKEVLILQDLSPLGYKMADRKAQLDFDHSAAALRAVAKFHGSSVRILKEHPELIKEIGGEFYKPEVMGQAKVNNFHVAAHEVGKWPEADKYASKLNEYGAKCWDLLAETLKLKEGELHVLNHGDFWLTNILYKHSADGKPIDVKLIDLQNCRYNSPAFDIHHLLYGSVQEDVRTARYEDLLSVYLTELNSTLERCCVKESMDMEQLKKALKDHEFFAVFTTIACLPFYVTDSNEQVDFEKMTSEEGQTVESSPLRFNYQSKPYRKLLPGRLSEFEKKGWF